MPKYPYKNLGFELDLENLEALNKNFDDVEADFREQKDDYTGKISDQNARIDSISEEITGDLAQEIIEDAKIIWLTPVDTFSDLATMYPSPSKGDTSMVRADGKVYRWNGTTWQEIQDIDPSAISEAEARFEKKLRYKQKHIELMAKASSKIKNNLSTVSFTFYGDSIFWQNQKAGTTVPPYQNNGESYIPNEILRVLNKALKGKAVVDENRTYPGDDVSRSYTRFKDIPHAADITFFQFGANDTKGGAGTAEGGTSVDWGYDRRFEEFVTYMTKYIELEIDNEHAVVLFGCPAPRVETQSISGVDPYREDMVHMNILMKQLADMYGCPFIDLFEMMKHYRDGAFPGTDQVHPSNVLREIGRKAAGAFLGQTLFRKEQASVNTLLEYGVRKQLDNFICSSNTVPVKDTTKYWSISGEAIVLPQDEVMLYGFYCDEPCIAYPELLLDIDGTTAEIMMDDSSNGYLESRTFVGGNTIRGNKITKSIAKVASRQLHINTHYKRNLSAPSVVDPNKTVYVSNFGMNAITKGWHTIQIKAVGGPIAVLGVSIEKFDATVQETYLPDTYALGTNTALRSFDRLTGDGKYVVLPQHATSAGMFNTPPTWATDTLGVLMVDSVKNIGTAQGLYIVTQTYFSETGKTFTRVFNSGANVWSAWKSNVELEYVTTLNETSPITAFEVEKTTYNMIALANAANLPESLAGNLITRRYRSDLYSYQEYRIYQTNKVYHRYWTGSAWSAWQKTSAV